MTSVIIRLQNLPMSANASNIRRFFAGLSIPEGGVHIVGGDDGDAFIAFATDEDARKAMLLDHQTINSSAVRLLLSSKAEMQSVIESARAAAMAMPSIAPQPTINSPIGQRNQYLRAHGSENFNEKSNKSETYSSYHYPPKAAVPDRSQQFNAPLPNSDIEHLPKPHHINADSLHDGGDYSYDTAPWNRMSDNSNQVTSKSIVPDVRKEISSGPQSYPDFRNQVPSMPEPSSHIDGDFRSHSSVPRRENTSETNLHGHKRAFNDSVVNEAYQGPPAKVNPSGNDAPHCDYAYDQFYNAQQYDNSQFNFGSYDSARRPNPPDNANGTQNNHWDFSVRPPWLNENNSRSSKPFAQVNDGIKSEEVAPPFKQNRFENALHENSPDTNFVAKIAICPQDVSIQAVFDILHGVNVIPRWGIRIEEDMNRRYTGYVYVMVNGRDALERAINQSGTVYRGRVVTVTSSSPSEFFRVTDSNFQAKCPSSLIHKLPPRSATKPLFYLDGCMELGDLPFDVTASEVVAFLGAPGLTPSDVKLTDAGARNQVGVRAVVRLPSSRDLDILLSAQPRPFRGNQGQPVRLHAISKMQYDFSSDRTISSFDKREIAEPLKTEPRQDATSKPPPVLPQATADAKTCAFIYGFVRPMNDYEISKLFPSVAIPSGSLFLVSNNKAALMNFDSEANCKKALTDFANNEFKLKEIHFNIAMRGITQSDFERRLREMTSTKPDRGATTSNSYQNESDARSLKPRDVPRFSARPPGPPNDYGNSRPPRPNYYGEPRPPRSDFYPRQPETFSNRPRMPNAMHMSPSSRPNGPPRSVTVHISNLPNGSPESVFDLFRQYGAFPGSLRLRRDSQGHPMGEAIISLPSLAEADRAMRDLNGYRFYGRSLAIRIDGERPCPE